MLGGSVSIAFIRFAISITGVILLFSILSESRFDRRRTMISYGCFCVAAAALACVWYVVSWETCIRMMAFMMYMCFAIFAIFMSRDSVYLTIYELALVFYLMSVFVIGSLEISVIFFECNIWADIISRIMLILVIAFLPDRYVRKSVKGFGDYVEAEADKFSIAAMVVCILFGIGYILNPMLNRKITGMRFYQILMNFVLTGTLQLLVFRVYLHVGREKEYERETDQTIPQMICANTAVNNILSAYTRKAKSEQIKVTLDVKPGKNWRYLPLIWWPFLPMFMKTQFMPA